MTAHHAPVDWWPTDGPCLVLLVDDEPDVDDAVRRILASEPCIDLHYCRDAAKAAMVARLLKPAVILQDLVMPGWRRSVAPGRLSGRSHATSTVPVIALLAEDDAAAKHRARSSGAADYLVKPPDATRPSRASGITRGPGFWNASATRRSGRSATRRPNWRRSHPIWRDSVRNSIARIVAAPSRRRASSASVSRRTSIRTCSPIGCRSRCSWPTTTSSTSAWPQAC